MIRAVVFDVGECLVDETREYGTWADWLGVPRHTFAAMFGAVIAQGRDYRETFQGLRTDASTSAYAQMLCTLAYTAARGGHRTEALAMTVEARRAAARLPETAPAGRLFPISPAAVDLYAVGVHWALGDAGAALEAGKDLRPAQFPTAERKARLGTDMARAW
ncbi:hypothetical protein M2283_008824 [Streptomyces pseudovenezuelae]|uniref:Haloacid dehalogenase n=1 Tax=Streptomyces pseudovenezuelae TaxID=67350 RepID=A0ABT6LYU8_9ACTN|nr:hypothetical protein [Streptomyces pseudovenezuelae]